MNDTMTPPPSPAPQPSQPEAPHKNPSTGLFIIVGLLGALLVLETLAFGYVTKNYVNREDIQERIADEKKTLKERLDALRASAVPFLYTDSGREGTTTWSHLIQVDRSTGEENAVYEADYNDFISVVAIPQVKYNGSVFLRIGCSECDNPYLDLFEFDMKQKGEPVALEVVEGDMFWDAVEVSPDQTKLAVAQYDDVFESSDGEIFVYDLLTGEKEVVGELGEGEYFSRWYGPNAFAGAGDFQISWKNRECFNVIIYEDPETPRQPNEKDYKEMREFCIEE